MSLSLSALPQEIHLVIAAAVGSDDNLPQIQRYQSHRIGDPQIRERENKRKSKRNLINWSCTSKYFRSLLAPLVFHTVILRNDDKSAASVEAIAAHLECVNHVQELHFIGSAPGDANRDDAAFSDTENILPEKVKNLLINLKRFPKLKGVNVEFDYDFGDRKEWQEEGANTVAEIETVEDVEESERSQAWRALMVKVWEAISENKAGVIEKLTISRLYYQETSAFTNPAFHSFLCTLKHFSISMWGGDNSAGWQTNTCETWSAFVLRLDEFFFNHLRNLTSFEFKATDAAPVGLTGSHHASLQLRKEHMPMLKTLHLEYMFLGPELRDFLVAKASTLQQVHLRSCLAEIGPRMGDSGIGWLDDGLHRHELFDAISSAQPKKLRQFRISEGWPAPLPKEYNDYHQYESKAYAEDENMMNEQIKEAREMVERGEKRVWAHVWVDHKYGMLFENLKTNFLSVREGRDQEAYERLIDTIGRNGGVEANVVEKRKRKREKSQGARARAQGINSCSLRRG